MGSEGDIQCKVACQHADNPASVSASTWQQLLQPEDLKGLTSLIYGHINLYGTFHSALSQCLNLKQVSSLKPLLHKVFLRYFAGCCTFATHRPDRTTPEQMKLLKLVGEFDTYVRNNRSFIPNYGDRYRNGERISTGFVESTVNQVVSQRMVKKQQMRWSRKGAHLLLQVRTQVLDGDWRNTFERWYSNADIKAA